jgi:uncharacterized protein YggE
MEEMMRSVLGAVLCLTLLSAVAAAEPPACPSPTGRHVTVTGSGVVRLPPDRVSFSVGVETEASSVAEAFKANAPKLSAVLAALKAKGVQPREIQTSNLEVASRDPQGKKLQGFRVSNLVTVTREDPSAVADLLQAAITAGANQAGGLRFFVAEPSKVQQRGLELAYRNAHSKAESLAALANQALGDALCVVETSPWGGNVQNTNLAGLGYVSYTSPVEVGSEQVSFGVSVTYELKGR